MNKINKFYKILYSCVFSILSLSVFTMKFEAYNPIFLKNTTGMMRFIREFEYAFKGFDIIYVTLWFLILYFYYKVYFDGEKFNKKKLLCWQI